MLSVLIETRMIMDIEDVPLRKKGTIHQVTTMLATSKMCPISRS